MTTINDNKRTKTCSDDETTTPKKSKLSVSMGEKLKLASAAKKKNEIEDEEKDSMLAIDCGTKTWIHETLEFLKVLYLFSIQSYINLELSI